MSDDDLLPGESDPYAEIAEWYDLEHDPVTEDVECYLELLTSLGITGRAAILEVGSGTGRIAVALATAGYDLTGIEPSTAMRLRGEARVAARPDRVAGRVHLLSGTADDYGSEAAASYQAIIFGLNTYAHLTDQQSRSQALALAARHLPPRGVLLIDLDLAGPRRLLEAPGQLFLQAAFRDRQDWITHLVAGVPGTQPGTLTVTHLYDVFQSGSEVRRRTLAQMSLAVLTSGELELSISVSGFDVEAMYGGFDLAAYDHLSPRAILVARRQSPLSGDIG
jgi:SAM-dependent methyltransferase